MNAPGNEERSLRVTIITAAYNAEPFLSAAIESVRAQTFGDFEYIIIDDGSRDRTADVVRRHMSKDPRVRLLQQSNRGAAAARNAGIRASRGEMIAFLDCDDLWRPEKLALQVAALDANPKAEVASCYSAVIGADGVQLGWQFGGDANGDIYWEMLEWDMVSGGSVPLCRRAAFDRVGFFDGSLPMRSDWDMWIRLARHGRYVTVPRVLVGYRRSPTSSSRQYGRLAAAGLAVLAKAAREDARFSPRYQRFCRARDTFAIACMCAIDDQVAPAWRYLARSLATTPLPVLRAPRRLAMVAVLVLKTLLPSPVFRHIFSWLSWLRFGLDTRRAFAETKSAP